MPIRAVIMDTKDNVATLLSDVKVGAVVVVTSADGSVVKQVKAARSIPFGHKVAVARIGKNELVLKYGEVIGEATETIEEGEHVHVHNIKSLRVKADKKLGQGGIA
jgi:hypothetical protein